MVKQKFNLDSSLIDLDRKNDYEEPSIQSVTLTFRVSKSFRRDFKKLCLERNISMVEALRKGFLLLEKDVKA